MSVVGLGDVEDHSMGVELRRGVAVDRTGAFPMRLSYALIAADKGGERNIFGCTECSIPTGTMFYARYLSAEFYLVSFGGLMANELRFRVRMLAFGQTREVLIANRT